MKYLRNIELFESKGKEKLNFELFQDICLDVTDITNNEPRLKQSISSTGEKPSDYYELIVDMKYRKNKFFTTDDYSYIYMNGKSDEKSLTENIINDIDKYLNSPKPGEKELKTFKKLINISDDIVDRLFNFEFNSLFYKISVYQDALYVKMLISIKVLVK